MGGWLAGLDALVVGLAYLFALLTTRFVVRPLLVSVLGQAPVIGGWLTSGIDARIADFERAITPAANASMGTLISALDWLTLQGRGLLGAVTALSDAVYAGLYHLGAETLGHAVGLGLQQVEALVAAARGYALGLFQRAEADTVYWIRAVESEAEGLAAEARKDALGEVSAAERVVLDEIRKAEGVTGQLFQRAEYDAHQLIDASEVRLAELVSRAREELAAADAAVEHDLQQLGKAVGVAVADTAATLGGDITAAEARFQAALAGVESGLGATIDEVIKSGPWGAAVALYEGGQAALAADVETLVRESLKQVRQEIGNAEALRARYAPRVRAAIDQLKAG